MPQRAHEQGQPATQLRRSTVVAVLALALISRLFVLWFAVAHNSATWLYHRGTEMGLLASSLLAGHGLASPFGGETGPTALIAPGYPIFVAGIFRIFGMYSPTSAVVIMLLHIAASVLTVWLMMLLAARFSTRAAVLAGAFWAVWPPVLWVPTIFWETSFSCCMMIGLIVLALHLHEQPTQLRWLAFAAFCGIASLINMALLISSVAVCAWCAFYTWRRARFSIVLAACLFALVYSPWPIRNARTFHAFVPLRTTVGLELWMGNQDKAEGYLNESLFPMYNKQELDTYLREGELGYDKDKSSAARAWIGSHPAAFTKLSFLRFQRFWSGTGTRNGPPVYMIGALFTSLAGLVGLYFIYRSGQRSLALLFALPLLFFPLPYYITHAEFRYRLVLDPLMTVLAAYALTQRRDRAF